MNFNYKTILNYQDYPIDDPDNSRRKAIVESVQASLSDDGCAVIPNFLSDPGLSQLLAEAEVRQPQTYYSPSKYCNVYLGEGDDSLPQDHPRNVFIPRTNGFITADLFDNNTVSRQLYDWAPLRRFLADCLGKPELYIYDDPISNMIVNVGKPGQQFNWHFDTNEFTITMLLKSARSGGEFEYVPNLRTQGDECYSDVKVVLEGSRQRTRVLELNAGDLQFFLGRYSLHQVTENTGNTDRLLLIMSFTEQPGVIGNPVRVKDLYGKLADVHQVERKRSDNLID
ncbi:MAG: hypothetical protein ACI8XC_004384 [Gammaproteobacteria bacterium]|jgi:hypothetical protein